MPTKTSAPTLAPNEVGISGVGAILLTIVFAQLLHQTPPEWWVAAMYASAAPIFAVRVQNRRAWICAVCLGLVIGLWYRFTHAGAFPLAIAIAYGLGAACVVVAGALISLGPSKEAGQRVRTALVVALFPFKTYLGLLLLGVVVAGTPNTFDTVLTALDQSLGGNISFALGRVLATDAPLRLAAAAAYNGLPIAVMTAAALRWRKLGKTDPTSIPLAAGLAAAVGLALYFIVPAAGPVFRWGTAFPFHPPTINRSSPVAAALATDAFRNAMPSLHFVAALLVVWNTWSLGAWQRLFGAAFLVFTFIATLGRGQHYVVDLVVAIPFALAVELLVRHAAQRGTGLLASVGLTLWWLLTIRFAPGLLLVHGVMWVSVAVTIFAAAMIGVRQARPRVWTHGQRSAGGTPLAVVQ